MRTAPFGLGDAAVLWATRVEATRGDDRQPRNPRDGERIAARAAAQACDRGEHLPVRLSCGPVPFEFDPWDPAGCVYAVASDNGCQY